MKTLSKEHVLLLHKILVKYSGGAEGLRDEGLLESALAAPFAAFGGTPFCPTIQDKAARLCYGLVKNHPFVDGNKRIGVLAMMAFLEANSIVLSCTDDELIKLGWGLADGAVSEEEVLTFITNHIK
jgi:death-on-curing protein